MDLSATLELSISAAPPELLPAESAEQPQLRALLAYWKNLPGSSVMPARPQINREIAPLLKRIHLSDVVDAGADFRFRLLGDAVFQCSTENQTGCLVSMHPDIAVRTRYPVLMREVVRLRAPVRGLSTRITSNTRMLVDSIWLPFGESDVAQILGMSVLTKLND